MSLIGEYCTIDSGTWKSPIHVQNHISVLLRIQNFPHVIDDYVVNFVVQILVWQLPARLNFLCNFWSGNSQTPFCCVVFGLATPRVHFVVWFLAWQLPDSTLLCDFGLQLPDSISLCDTWPGNSQTLFCCAIFGLATLRLNFVVQFGV